VSRRLAAALAAAALSVAPAARAETDLFGPGAVSGFLDLRVAAADGERSWLKGGYGKLEDGGGGDFAVRPRLGLAALTWRPQIAGDLGAYVQAEARSDQDLGVDLSEAFLTYNPAPRSAWRWSARAGLVWPPVSLEHDGPSWTVSRTLTPSALNTWIAEEVKTVAVEASLSREIGGHRLVVTAAAFEFNDTSGTLLSFRGWGLHDVRTTAFATLPLTRFDPRRAAVFSTQAEEARPTMEIDERIGGYARIEWRPPAPVAVHLFHYDNEGDPRARERGQWGWRTHFSEAGLVAQPAQGWEVLAQALSGRTYIGRRVPLFVDVDYSAAYVLASRTWDGRRVSGRIDWFEARDNSNRALDDNAEHGWAATAAYAHPITPKLGLWFEALHVWSDRAGRAYLGDGARQAQTRLQVALRAAL